MKYYELNDGNRIPVIGTGTNTFGKVDNNYHGEVLDKSASLHNAIKNGFRLIDTAVSYRNESIVGEAVENSHIPREDFFITTKLPGKTEYAQNPKAIIDTINESLRNLRTDYIDLYLIHHPWDNMDEMVNVWKVMEEKVREGKIKSLGVSNFNVQQLEEFIQRVTIKPVLNQIESHPGMLNDDIIDTCIKWDVLPQAWSPLSVDNNAKGILTEIGNKYNKNWAQVLLNYQVDRGVCVIPKSHDDLHQQENINIFDFKLDNQDKDMISKL